MPTSAAPAPASLERVLKRLRDDDPRHLVVQPQREPVARHREDPREHRDRPEPPSSSAKRSSDVEVEDDLRHRELARRPRASARKRSASTSRSSAVGLTATPTKNDVGASIGRPLKSSPRFSPVMQPREPDRVDLVDAARARVVADLGRVAGDREDVADALGVRAEQHRLEAEDRVVARRQVRDRLERRSRARSRPRPSASSCRPARSRCR